MWKEGGMLLKVFELPNREGLWLCSRFKVLDNILIFRGMDVLFSEGFMLDDGFMNVLIFWYDVVNIR